MKFKHIYATVVAGEKHIWNVERLWSLAKELSSTLTDIESIQTLDENCWFFERKQPTVREVASHVKRIYEADLSYPIILSVDGVVMDGVHRLAKAFIFGKKKINVVQFEVMPSPDIIQKI
ncbi:chromosome partitioning protein ParB [Candidatus Uabimicrobium sp. HlEnr_7]|uniref:chromosome partitioning protein ParB n=1 Tax=Candidatus Uabimicrobium helgolandensis TaxID=3095367 RepID=UPI00355909C8